MELTQEQIRRIENYLDSKNLVYIDIRIEVLDHMISDIEKKMSIENINFNDAFKMSVRKWHPQLSLSSSWIIGLVYSRPKIVIQKATKIFLKWFVLLALLLIVTAFFETKETVAFINKNFPFNFNIAVMSLLIISNSFIVNWYIKILRSKTKSSYLFLFEKQVFYASIFFTLVILADYLSGVKIASSLGLIYVPFIPITTVLGFIYLNKFTKLINI